MKHTLFAAASALTLAGISNGNAANASVYANTISANNIISIQHTITQTAFSSFSGSMRGAMGAQKQRTLQTSAQSNEDPTKTYGRAPMYGTAPMYGEFNDDGSAGRSGGDIFNPDAALNSIWANWQHLGDNAKMNNFAPLDSDTDTFMLGIAGGQSDFAGGLSKWGLYTGFVNGEQTNSDINIEEHGGYFGIYNGNTFGNFGLYATLNGGVLNNSAKTPHGTDEYSNFWLGGTISATYDFTLDNTFTLQPGINLGYTWIRAEDYTSASGDIMNNDAFGAFEVSPALRAIKYIGDGWFGSLNAKYVMTFRSGGNISVNTKTIEPLESDDYTEYTLSLEKYVNNFNFSANFGRRDGARYGWIGGINIKYAF